MMWLCGCVGVFNDEPATELSFNSQLSSTNYELSFNSQLSSDNYEREYSPQGPQMDKKKDVGLYGKSF